MKKTRSIPRPVPLRELFAWADDDENAFAPPPPQPSQPDSTEFYPDIMTALTSTAPSGSSVFAVGFENTDVFLRAGYKLADTSDNAFVTVARGGEEQTAIGKRTAKNKLILCPTRDYCATVTKFYPDTDKGFAVTKAGKQPDAVVFDPQEIASPATTFGELAAMELCAFDYAFGSIMRGATADAEVQSAVAGLVTDITAKLKGKEKDEAFVRTALTDACKRAAQIVEKTPELFRCSGAAQTYEAARMLFRHEAREPLPRGDAEMLLAVSLTDFYIKNIGAKQPLFPPDNNKRIDSVCEYLGADLIRSTVYVSPIYPPQKLKLCEYRCREFRTEQLQTLCNARNRLAAAFSVFKRLFPDDGYSLKDMIPTEDIGICIALAPDVYAADSMLSYFKQTGLLEKLII